MRSQGVRTRRASALAMAAVATVGLVGCAPVQDTGTAVCAYAPDGEQVAIGLWYEAGPYPETVTAIDLVDPDGLALVDARIDDNEVGIGTGSWPTDDPAWVDGGPVVGATLPAGRSGYLTLVLERTAEVGSAEGVLLSYDSLAGAGMRVQVAMGLELADAPCG